MAIASIANLPFDSTSSVAFRNWGSQIATSLQTCGLVQASDTGQINWSTVNATAAASDTEQMMGFEVYKFNDSLQATAPVFIKIEYGFIVANGANYNIGAPSIYVTVGTTTNGSGTLGGTLSTRTRLVGGSSSGTSSGSGSTFSPITTPCYFSGNGSYINVGLGISSSNIGSSQWGVGALTIYSSFPAMLSIDRSRNSDGSINDHGLVFLTSKWTTTGVNNAPTSAVPTCQYLSFTGQGVGTQLSYWPIVWPGPAFGNGTNGSNLELWPLTVATPQPEAQGPSVLGCYSGDLAIASTITVSVLGSNHTYISFAGIGGVVANDNTRSYTSSRVTGGAILMRYE